MGGGGGGGDAREEEGRERGAKFHDGRGEVEGGLTEGIGSHTANGQDDIGGEGGGKWWLTECSRFH